MLSNVSVIKVINGFFIERAWYSCPLFPYVVMVIPARVAVSISMGASDG
ncbi:MAG: hypothetical protein ACXV2E_06125 [Halobacteriota archaeon]